MKKSQAHGNKCCNSTPNRTALTVNILTRIAATTKMSQWPIRVITYTYNVELSFYKTYNNYSGEAGIFKEGANKRIIYSKFALPIVPLFIDQNIWLWSYSSGGWFCVPPAETRISTYNTLINNNTLNNYVIFLVCKHGSKRGALAPQPRPKYTTSCR